MRRRDVMLAPVASLALTAKPKRFRFVHFTDTHIQPELRATEGTRQCFDAIRKTGADFALAGGDLVMDADAHGLPRAKQLYDLYRDAVKRLEMPVYSVPGNHDVFGTAPKSGVAPTDPLYNKKMFEERIGPCFSSFDHKGWHFILLDSIGLNAERQFVCEISDQQLDWLRRDLEKTGRQTPIVAMTHVPLLSSVMQIVPDPWKSPSTYLVQNARRVLDLFSPYQLRAVLQGHTHIRENVVYNGCQFLTSGAVCGNWWKGSRLGHPEGFALLTVEGPDVRWEYRTYGFQADPA
jgi:3',5'-cyclic AMP phosphodiesterase CpdA